MSDRHHDPVHRLEALSLEESSTSDSELESHSYLLCNNRTRFEQFSSVIEELNSTQDPWRKPFVFLSCEGRDVGRVGGRLGLVEIGVKEDIYLLDVLTYSRNLEVLKSLCGNDKIEKILWDGRNVVSELWHGHEIALKAPLDLQLVHVYEQTGGRLAPRGFLRAESMSTAFLNLDAESHEAAGLDDVRGFTRRQEEIQRKQQNDNDYWLRRPLTLAGLDYSSFKIVQLRTLYNKYLDAISKYSYMDVESQRYVELYKDERRAPNTWFLDHNILPQEILERSRDEHELFDLFGTRVCAGCRRALHQDSFRDSFATRWPLRLGEHGRLCYTCHEARRLFRESQRNTASPARLTSTGPPRRESQ